MAITRKDLLREIMPGLNALFDVEYSLFKKYGQGDEVDKHKYETEAKDLPIEACVSMWIIKYGDGKVPAIETTEQGALLWEIGNRLWWANRMNYDQANDTYEIIE